MLNKTWNYVDNVLIQINSSSKFLLIDLVCDTDISEIFQQFNNTLKSKQNQNVKRKEIKLRTNYFRVQ